jgi:glycerol-3-phosphate O-acyltransferase
VAQLLREGFNIEVFIEGGRSRTGKPLTPKTGFLSILLEAFAQGSCDELVLAPVFIGYDKVPEEKAYLHELEGGQKEPESLVQMIRARKFLKKRFGKIYIGFAEPMLLGDLLESQGLSLDSATKEDKEAFCRHIGHRAINAFNRAAVITPHSIMAAALLNGAKDPFTTGDISGITDIYCRHLQFCGAKLSDTLVLDPARSLSQAFDAYLHRKWVERFSKDTPPSDPECRYTIPEAKRPSLDFYKNNGIAPFVPAAFTAMTILSLDAFQFSSRDLASGYRFLQDLFKHEFSFDLEKSPEFFLRRSIKSFIDDAVLMPHPTLPDTYNITSAGLRTLRVFAHFCRPFLEAYSVVVDYLEQHAAEGLSAGEHLKGIGSHGNRMFKRKDVGLKESLSRITFQNALAFFNARGIFGREDNTAISSYGAQIRRYLERFQT